MYSERSDMGTDIVYLFDLGTRYLVEGEGFALVEHTLPPRALGSPLPAGHLAQSDVVLPGPWSTLAEVRSLLGEEGLIPG